MKTDVLPALIWILHTEDSDLAHLAPITRLDITEGASTNFHDDGLFSTRIFGPVGSVQRDEVFAKLKLNVRVLHPKIYRDLINLKALYKEILEGSRTAKFSDVEGDFYPSVDADAETGYAFFMFHLDKLKLKRTESPARNERIDFLERWWHRKTLTNLPVMPAGLRDIEIGEDGRWTKHEINDFYFRVMYTALNIAQNRDTENVIYDSPRLLLTKAIYEIYSYVERIIGGKSGFIRDKWASRRVLYGTRNVLTSMETSGYSLESPNVPAFDATVLGTFQAAVALAPVVVFWMRTGYLSKIMTAGDGDVMLVNTKTLKPEWTSLSPTMRDRWTTFDGLREVINSLVDIEARHRPVMIGTHYLSLVYNGEGTFRVFDDIDDLPENFDRKDVHPMTLIELIYLSGYSKWVKYFLDVVRYPINGDDSTYPSRMHVKTTSVGEIRRELDTGWMPLEGDEYLAVEYPNYNLRGYHDSESPAPSRLVGLGADFDGDTGSGTAVMTNDALRETEKYLSTREAWVKPSGEPRAQIDYDTADFVIKNLTGRFNHVKQASHKALAQKG